MNWIGSVGRARSVALSLLIATIGAALTAQTPFASSPRLLHFDPTRLTPGQFVYETVLEHDITATALGSRTVSAAPTTYTGTNAWLLLESKSGGTVATVDSLFVDQTALRPLHWSSTIGRAHLGIEFRNDSAFGGTTAPSGRQSVFSAVPPATMINAAMLEMALRTLPLNEAWEDSTTTLSVSLNGVTPLPTRVAVIGEVNVRVPAGQFDCWVVSVRAADLTRGMYWVTKRDPIVVRSALDVPGLNGAQYVSTLTSQSR
jgi:hypothetical protein